MTANIDNLMENVYQYFLDLYQQIGRTSSEEIFLAFEPIGRSVDSDSYKLNPTDSSYLPAKAIEELTELTDDIPTISADVFRRTAKSIEEIYEDFILVGSTFGTEDQGEVSLFNHVKAKAQQKFEDAKIGKFGQPGVYRPNYADPQDWYDPNQLDNWTAHTCRMEQQQSSSQGNPPEIRLNPAIRRWQWQVLPQELTPVLTQPQIIKTVSISPMTNEVIRAELNQKVTAQVVKTRLSPTIRSSVELTTRQPTVMKTASFRTAQPMMARPPLSNLVVSEKMISKVVLAETISQQPNPNSGEKSVKQIISPIVLNNIRLQIANPQQPAHQVVSPVRQACTMDVLLGTTSTKSVESTQLSVSFQYCIIHVDRPWFSYSLLQTKGWYVPGFEAGEFSNGKMNNNGLFPALPIAFIVVKDLNISGWSQSEYEYVKNAIALGPFSLLNRKINQQKLTCDGMQVIGWISQVMPFMPPLSDPDPR